MISQGSGGKNGKNETGNNSSKDGSNPKAESAALIEAAKSKIHQVRTLTVWASERQCERHVSTNSRRCAYSDSKAWS
uniref:Uncharacterized protein n=1 Tax=Mus musculus TaxID=10090 RepID=Q3TJV1_MOUSE|nr:unnamed protein product [Mus musculus]